MLTRTVLQRTDACWGAEEWTEVLLTPCLHKPLIDKGWLSQLGIWSAHWLKSCAQSVKSQASSLLNSVQPYIEQQVQDSYKPADAILTFSVKDVLQEMLE